MSDAGIRKIKTTRFGEIEVSDGTSIELEGGVIGFPGRCDFVLLDYNPPFSWLQSTEDPALAFVVVKASEFGEDYHSSITKNNLLDDIGDAGEIAVFNIVTANEDVAQTTVNLKAPVVVSLKQRRGRQVILENNDYPTKYRPWE